MMFSISAAGVNRYMLPMEEIRSHFPKELASVEELLQDASRENEVLDVAFGLGYTPNSSFAQAVASLKDAFLEKFQIPLYFGTCLLSENSENEEEEISQHPHFYVNHSDLYAPSPFLLDLKKSGIHPEEVTLI